MEIPFINCEIELHLRWTTNSMISEASKTSTMAAGTAVTSTTSAGFRINRIKFYVPIVTLPINDNINFLKNRNQGFKRTAS